MLSWLGGNTLPALLAAAFWGVGDFSGGMSVRRAGGTIGAALRVLLISHLASFAVLLVVIFVRGDAFPHGAPLAWGLLAGVFGGLSLAAFYIALSRGAMGASAAVSGVLAAAIPALVSSFTEGFAGPRRIVGFLVAGAAIWLIAAGSAKREETRTMLLAIGAGAGFGLYFTALKFAGPAGLFWPMANARMGSLATCGSLLLLAGRGGPVVVNRNVVLWAMSAALFDTSGNLLYIAATRAGRLDVAAVLASLYPASTILLAGWLLKERLTGRQVAGMGVAVGAVALISF